MNRRKQIALMVLGISVAVLIVVEINDHFYSLMFFAEPAVPMAHHAVCRSLVMYKPFWREKVYAVNMTQPGDWLNYYYAGDQDQIKATVQACQKMREKKQRDLYY